MSIRKLCSPLSLCSSAFILSFSYDLDIYKEQKLHNLENVSELGLSVSLDQTQHGCGADLHLRGEEWPGGAHDMGCPTVDDILFGPFYKAVFFDRCLLKFFLFYFSFCISQEICAREL